MKIKREVLSGFLKKVVMKSDSVINEAIFHFGPDAVEVGSVTNDNTTMVNARLSKSAFQDYSAIGEVGFERLPTMIKTIDTFKDDVELNVENGEVRFSETDKIITMPVIEPSFINTKGRDLSNMEHDHVIKLPSSVLHGFIKDVSALNNEYNVVFRTGDKMVQISNDIGHTKVAKTIREVDCEAGTVVKFGNQFFNAISALAGDLEISLKSDYPIKISESTDVSKVEIVIAPRVENANVVEVQSDTENKPKAVQGEEPVEEVNVEEPTINEDE